MKILIDSDQVWRLISDAAWQGIVVHIGGRRLVEGLEVEDMSVDFPPFEDPLEDEEGDDQEYTDQMFGDDVHWVGSDPRLGVVNTPWETYSDQPCSTTPGCRCDCD